MDIEDLHFSYKTSGEAYEFDDPDDFDDDGEEVEPMRVDSEPMPSNGSGSVLYMLRAHLTPALGPLDPRLMGIRTYSKLAPPSASILKVPRQPATRPSRLFSHVTEADRVIAGERPPLIVSCSRRTDVPLGLPEAVSRCLQGWIHVCAQSQNENDGACLPAAL
mmetsp:Transcript_11171/g.23485  ORF Transcript_11171/g.23485 Transcript_11171/m.23485 type:complete len:163 (-) Transcript_11171:112-600(-)